MEPEVRERFERIEADLDRSGRRHREAMLRIDREHKLAMERMAKFDQQLQATRKLVQAGMKIVSQLAVDAREARKETKELKAEFKAYLRAQRNGHNGSNGREH